MTETGRVALTRIPTGVIGLDEILGGGLPEYSFNLIAGEPGSGKTTLAHQIVFTNATEQRRALYFTVLGEPALKMLRYQQQLAFFDPARIGTAIRFVDLSQEVLTGDLGRVLDRIVKLVEETDPGIVVVDSFRTVLRSKTSHDSGETELQGFLQRLALFLTSWEATSFLVGEYEEAEMRDNPVFTVADGIIWMYQSRERNSVVRKLRVVKMRGQAHMPGMHTFRMSDAGIQVFPRIHGVQPHARRSVVAGRLRTGVPGLDELMGGGIPAADSILVAGPSGTGKTLLGTQFIAAGIEAGEHGVLVVFEERPEEYVRRAKSLGMDLEAMVDKGALRVLYLRPLDLSVDETLYQIRQAVAEIGALRLVVDSLSGFELALAPTFRDEFRESLYRMVGVLMGEGVTVMMTVEVPESFEELRFSPHAISFLSGNIILLRHAEIDGGLVQVLTVAKMRRSAHSRDLRTYEITPRGMVVGPKLAGYRGILGGSPQRLDGQTAGSFPGLTEGEAAVLRDLLRSGEAGEDGLVRTTGLAPSAVQSALARLLALDYALRKTAAGGRETYVPVSRTPGG